MEQPRRRIGNLSAVSVSRPRFDAAAHAAADARRSRGVSQSLARFAAGGDTARRVSARTGQTRGLERLPRALRRRDAQPRTALRCVAGAPGARQKTGFRRRCRAALAQRQCAARGLRCGDALGAGSGQANQCAGLAAHRAGRGACQRGRDRRAGAAARRYRTRCCRTYGAGSARSFLRAQACQRLARRAAFARGHYARNRASRAARCRRSRCALGRVEQTISLR